MVNVIKRGELTSLIRGTLQVALALLAAASFGGWVVTLGVLAAGRGSVFEVTVSFWIITLLYSLLALAVGNALGRRQGVRGVAASATGALLAWGILELFYAMWQIGSPQMRAPLVMGVAMTVVGAFIGVSRKADREALRVELQQELTELEREESEPADKAADNIE